MYLYNHHAIEADKMVTTTYVEDAYADLAATFDTDSILDVPNMFDLLPPDYRSIFNSAQDLDTAEPTHLTIAQPKLQSKIVAAISCHRRDLPYFGRRVRLAPVVSLKQSVTCLTTLPTVWHCLPRRDPNSHASPPVIWPLRTTALIVNPSSA